MICPNSFSFCLIENKGRCGDTMAKSHFSFKKREKELARKLKQEQKRQRKFKKDTLKPEDNPPDDQDQIENLTT